jgi:hypothetical protein
MHALSARQVQSVSEHQLEFGLQAQAAGKIVMVCRRFAERCRRVMREALAALESLRAFASKAVKRSKSVTISFSFDGIGRNEGNFDRVYLSGNAPVQAV